MIFIGAANNSTFFSKKLEYVLKQEFKLLICLKLHHFRLKIVKIAQRWGLCLQTPYASGGWGLRTQTPTLALYRYGFLAVHLIATFM